MTETAIYLHQPITIELEDSNNGSVVTLSSETNQPAYMTGLRDITQEWCTGITQTYEGREAGLRRVAEADAIEQNNQVVCDLQIRKQDLINDGILQDLKDRLKNAQERTMSASAGEGISGGPGLQGDIETRGA